MKTNKKGRNDNETGNSIGDTGAYYLSEGLKINTTLTQLDLGGDDKNMKYRIMNTNRKRKNDNDNETDNNIGDAGAQYVSEVLKNNTTLTQLDLGCDEKEYEI